MKTEMKWASADMLRAFHGPLAPARVMAQDAALLRAHLRWVTQIAARFDQHRAGLQIATAHEIVTGPAAALNAHERVVDYEAVVDSMEVVLRDAVDLHAL